MFSWLVSVSGGIKTKLKPPCWVVVTGALQMAKSELLWQLVPASGRMETKPEPSCLVLTMYAVGSNFEQHSSLGTCQLTSPREE